MTVMAEIAFGQVLLLILEFFLLMAWFWVLFVVITDLFRDREHSGWSKAVWVFFLILLPWLGVLIYLIARGGGMADRNIKAQAEAKKEFDSYIREQAHPASQADELHKLAELKDRGALSTEEFEKAKQALLN